MDISIIVPTSTWAANIPELVTRIGAAETRSTGRSPLVNYPVRSLRGFGKVRRMGSS